MGCPAIEANSVKLTAQCRPDSNVINWEECKKEPATLCFAFKPCNTHEDVCLGYIYKLGQRKRGIALFFTHFVKKREKKLFFHVLLIGKKYAKLKNL